MIIVKGLMMWAGILLLISLPQLLTDVVNALPQPLPQIIGVAMLVALTAGFIGLINKLMKGIN
jgi:hypothetical protein